MRRAVFLRAMRGIMPAKRKTKTSVETIHLPPNWVGMFDAAIANARSNKDNLGVEMLEFGKRLYIAQSGLSFPVGQVGQEPKK